MLAEEGGCGEHNRRDHVTALFAKGLIGAPSSAATASDYHTEHMSVLPQFAVEDIDFDALEPPPLGGAEQLPTPYDQFSLMDIPCSEKRPEEYYVPLIRGIYCLLSNTELHMKLDKIPALDINVLTSNRCFIFPSGFRVHGLPTLDAELSVRIRKLNVGPLRSVRHPSRVRPLCDDVAVWPPARTPRRLFTTSRIPPSLHLRSHLS